MAGAFKFSIRFQTKCISLPCRSHPMTFEIEELINRIKTTANEAASADEICSGLSQLGRLYKCVDEILNSSSTKLLMAREENKKWVDEFVDESVKCLDICGSMSDMLAVIKEHNRELLSALRRRKGELSFRNSIMKYNCFRKKMKKDIRFLVGGLKQVDNMIKNGGGGSVVVDHSDNYHLSAVIRAVIGVSEMTILVFESLLRFFCVPVSKPNKWSLVMSKLMHKGIVGCEEQQENGMENEFARTDASLRILCKYGINSSEMGNVQIAQCRLDGLGQQIERMEGGLECIFRCLVQARVSLLNIMSQ
ncbi:hypothetical protein SSX86_010035 [Deinandra increscens subsp. villosa]|uniref:Uncharacterized protein n=1 Tax=Deinandra increscens subsp. villosa TaxID=3103831 RepID=A0AAP0DBK7_9ASTR